MCHSRTKNLKEFTLKADIIIAAIGIPEFLKADMVKENVLQCEQRTGIGRFTGYENILTLSWNKHSITWIESTQSGYFHELFMLQRDRGDLQRGGVMAMEFNFFEKVNDMMLSRYGMFWTCKKSGPLF